MTKVQSDVITLCGSVRFKKEFMQEEERLTKMGYVVLKPGCWNHLSDDVKGEERELKTLLTILHFKKISMSDRIHVINKGGYIGVQTAIEIALARSTGKDVSYMEEQW